MRRAIERKNELYVARGIVKNSFIEVLMWLQMFGMARIVYHKRHVCIL